ncbi:hypothetical protein [Moorena producens]|uniref:hypothetical protein n=1 Tax=Moorena producens TaxID=1155739 RepID=UPI003C7295C1
MGETPAGRRCIAKSGGGVMAFCHCLDAVAHGGNPQDRAASLKQAYYQPTRSHI